jgi:Flp pilus assembly protein TadG
MRSCRAFPAIKPRARRNRGQALLELALVTPLLVLFLVGAADIARVYSANIEITNMAREGAHYGSLSSANASDTDGIEAAALGEGSSIDGTEPTVTSETGTDGFSQGSDNFSYVRVTVTYDFHPLFPIPPIPGTITLHRTAEMRVMGQ